MTGATVRESVKVAGLVERVRVVRSFVGAVLGPGHPCGDDAMLLASDSLNLSNSFFCPFWRAFVSAGWTGCQGLPLGRAGG
jgi:hypothetical protein